MRIGVIGGGVVGGATAQAFASHVDEVRVYDSNPLRCTATLVEVLDTDLVFVCLPTPQKAGLLECETKYLDMFFSVAHDTHPNANYVLKSTVPIGYTRKTREKIGLVNLIHSPEFLTARTAVHDAANPNRILIGEPNWTPTSEQTPCADKLQELCEKAFFVPSGDPFTVDDYTPPIYFMSSDESEAVKLMQNSYSAVVIATLNEFRCLADKTGMDWGRVMGALLASGWLAPRHTQVPGPDGKRGFSGSCLPKDLANLMQCMMDNGVCDAMCFAAQMRNEHDRKE